jgi:hypothetical protein
MTTGIATAAVIIGAILASHDKHPVEVEAGVTVADWAVGRFKGDSPKTDRYIDITIKQAGAVTGTLDQDPFTGKVSKDGRPYLGDAAFKMKQQSCGVVDTHVFNLPKKVEALPARPRYLHSVRGMGYRFDG